MKIFDVLAIGDANIDLTLKVDHLPRNDDKVIGRRLVEQVGGTTANSACVCGSLGLNVTTLSNVGTNADGRRIIDEYKKYHINTDFLISSEDFEASKVVIMLDDTGEKSLIYVPSTDYYYPDDILRSSILQSHFIYTMPGDLVFFQKIGKFAQASSSKVVVDIEPTIITDSSALDTILMNSDLVFFNEDGFVKATGAEPAEAKLSALVGQYDLDGIVVTLGAKGAMANIGGEFATHDGFDVPVVDTTGAGDTFNASFLYSHIKHFSLAESLQFSCASAAVSIGGVGPKGAVPTIDVINQFIARNN